MVAKQHKLKDNCVNKWLMGYNKVQLLNGYFITDLNVTHSLLLKYWINTPLVVFSSIFMPSVIEQLHNKYNYSVPITASQMNLNSWTKLFIFNTDFLWPSTLVLFFSICHNTALDLRCFYGICMSFNYNSINYRCCRGRVILDNNSTSNQHQHRICLKSWGVETRQDVICYFIYLFLIILNLTVLCSYLYSSRIFHNVCYD